MLLGDRLRAGREYLGLSQKEIAAKAGVSLASWQGYERNSSLPGSKVLESLCHLGFFGNWLLTGEGPMHLDQEVSYQPSAKSPAAAKSQEQAVRVEPTDEELDVADQWGLEEEEILELFEEFWSGLSTDLKELVAEQILEYNDLFGRWVKKRIRRGKTNATQSKAVNG